MAVLAIILLRARIAAPIGEPRGTAGVREG